MAAGAAGRLPKCEKPLKGKSQKVLKVGGVIFDNFMLHKSEGKLKYTAEILNDSDIAINFKLYVAHV